MILLIILGAILLASIILVICALLFYWDGLDILGYILALVSGVALSTCGIISIVHNNPMYMNYERFKIQETIISLNSAKAIQIESGAWVMSYNQSVSEYKYNIYYHQQCLNNPWINCLYCPVYNEFDINAVDYLYAN